MDLLQSHGIKPCYMLYVHFYGYAIQPDLLFFWNMNPLIMLQIIVDVYFSKFDHGFIPSSGSHKVLPYVCDNCHPDRDEYKSCS